MRFNDLEIRPPKKTDSPKAYLDFICAIIEENTYILIDKKPTLKEETAWFKERLKSISLNQEICLTAWDGKKVVANCQAIKDKWKDEKNVHLGIAIDKDYRGHGLGEFLLKELVRRAKKKLRPKNIYLKVFSDNNAAKGLYQKVGFRKIAHFPEWTYHKGKFVGHDVVLLSEWKE